MHEIVEERKKTLSDVEKKIVSTYREHARSSTREQEKLALDYFYQFCVKLFSTNANLLVGIMGCTEKGFEFIKDYKPPRELIEEILAPVSEKEIQEALRKTIAKVIVDEKILPSLSVIARNYLYFRILNLDPECKSLQRKIFSNKMLLVDTNFIMGLLLPSQSSHKAAIQCVSLSKKLGVNLRFTNRTKQEFLEQVTQSRKRFRAIGITKIDVLSALDDDLIVSYSMEKRKRPHTTWAEFSSRFRGIDGILAKWGIRKYSDIETEFEVTNIDPKKVVTGFVMTCAFKKGGNKNVAVAEHDSHHLLLIRKLREKETPDALGPKSWFLTFDKTLLCVDMEINEFLGYKDDLPSNIECWVWIEMMLPLVSGEVSKDTAHEAFSQLMRTEFSVLPAKIGTRKLTAIHSPNVDFNEYTLEEIRALLNDDFVTECWRNMKKAKLIRSPKAEEYKEKMHKRVETVADSIKLSKAKTELTARYASIAVSVFMIALATYCVVAQNYLGAGISAIVALVFMAMGIGYRKLELTYKKIKLYLSK